MKRRSQALLLLAAIIVVAYAAACAPANAPSRPATAIEPVTTYTKVKAVGQPFLALGGVFIAEEEGYFAQQGVELEYVELNSGQEALPALLQGDIDVLTLTVNAGMINAIARGGNVRIVAPMVRFTDDDCAFAGVVGRSDLVLENLKAEKSTALKVATNPVGTEGFYTDRYLQSLGLSLDGARVEDVPPPALADALSSGSVDIAHASEPWLTRVLETGKAKLLAPAQTVTPNLDFAVIMFGPGLLKANPDAGKRWMAAYLQGVRQYAQGKTDRNVEILEKHTGLDADLIKRACWPVLVTETSVNEMSLLDYEAWAFNNKLLDRIIPVADLFDPRFVQSAVGSTSP